MLQKHTLRNTGCPPALSRLHVEEIYLCICTYPYHLYLYRYTDISAYVCVITTLNDIFGFFKTLCDFLSWFPLLRKQRWKTGDCSSLTEGFPSDDAFPCLPLLALFLLLIPWHRTMRSPRELHVKVALILKVGNRKSQSNRRKMERVL